MRRIWQRLRPNRRERVALIVLLIPAVAGGVLALMARSADTTLTVERMAPTKQLTVTADGGDGSGSVRAESSVVAIGEFSPGGERGSASLYRRLELSLPVPRGACERLRSRIGGQCDGVGAPRAQAAGALTVEWPSGGRVTVEAAESRSIDLRPTPVVGAAAQYQGINMQVDARDTEVEFECVERDGFRLVFGGRVLPLRCDYGPAEYTIAFRFDPSSAPALFLTGLGPWRFEGLGNDGTVWVDRGSLSIDGGRRPVDSRSEVVISAGRPEVSATVGNLDSGSQAELTVHTGSADSVEVTGDQVLPSRLSPYRDYWLLILGITGGVLLAIFFERVPGRDQ